MVAEVQTNPLRSPSFSPGSPDPGTMKTPGRDRALDIVKGVLVVLMALYHGINYTAHLGLAFKWLGFLPPAFIFINGLLLSIVYTRKYDLDKPHVYSRLAFLGFKLGLLFTSMNIAVFLLRSKSQSSVIANTFLFFQQWKQVYLSGSGRVAVFEVLLPIAYFLLLSPVFLFAYKVRPATIPFFCAVVTIGCVLLEARVGLPDNIALWSAGLIGMSIGLVKEEIIKRVSVRWPAMLAAYLCYRTLSSVFGETYLVQMLGVLVTFFLWYGGALLIRPGNVAALLTLLGKYSLIAYVAQIVFLQGYSAVFGRDSESPAGVAFLFFAGGAVSAAVAYVTDRLRRLSARFNTTYQAVFP